MAEERRDLVSQRAPGVIAEVNRVRAILAPTGQDLEKLLVKLHRESAIAQRKARESQAKLRAELYRRLEEGQTLEIHGNEVVVSVCAVSGARRPAGLRRAPSLSPRLSLTTPRGSCHARVGRSTASAPSGDPVATYRDIEVARLNH